MSLPLTLVVSLFSVFDSSSLFPFLSWIVPTLVFILFLPSAWIVPPSVFGLASLLGVLLKTELDSSLYVNQYHVYSCLFLWGGVVIFSINSLGLLPYVFTSTSHISLSVPLALSLWMSFMAYGWFSGPGVMLMALVPSGTPLVLMPFMVLIESISIAIRPITLSVRLSANMIAGHLLLSLCGGGFEGVLSIFLLFVCQTMLMVLEVAVAAIQAYVFTVLVTLYSKETCVHFTYLMNSLSISQIEVLI